MIWHDLGSGTGAVAHAAAAFFTHAGLPPEQLKLHLYDATGTLLDAARVLLEEAGLKGETHRVALERLETKKFLPQAENFFRKTLTQVFKMFRNKSKKNYKKEN